MTFSAGALRAFVIGPIGDRDASDGSSSRIAYEEGVQVLEEIIVPACSAFGVHSFRADEIDRTGEIPEQVFRHLRDAPIVIADLTNANPNVMYELGLRHTTGKLTIQIGERGRLPFDIASIRTVMFKRSPAGLVKARRRLSQILANDLESGGDPVAATRVWFEVSQPTQTISSSEGHDSDASADEPFLEKIADSEDSLQSIGQVLSAISSITEEIRQVMTEGTARIQENNAQGGTSSSKLVLVNRVAALLEDPVSRLQVAAGEFGQSVDRLEPGLKYLLKQLDADAAQAESSMDFLAAIRGLISVAESSIVGSLGFKSAVEASAEATRDMRRVATRLALALQAISNSSARIVALGQLIDRLPLSSETGTGMGS